MLNLKNGKLFPKSEEEYEAILYLMDEDLFYFEYLRPEVRAFVEGMTEEEKKFHKNEKSLDNALKVCYNKYRKKRKEKIKWISLISV